MAVTARYAYNADQRHVIIRFTGDSTGLAPDASEMNPRTLTLLTALVQVPQVFSGFTVAKDPGEEILSIQLRMTCEIPDSAHDQVREIVCQHLPGVAFGE